MKKFILILLLCPLVVFAEETKLASNIDAVTVFLQGAQVERSAKATIKPGTNTLVFNELTTNLQPASIQLQGLGDFTILSIQHQRSSDELPPAPPEIAQMETRREQIDEDLLYQNKLGTVYAEEKKMIFTNNKLSGQDNGVDPDELLKMANFWRTRLTEIEKLDIERNRKIKALNKEKAEINKKIQELTPKRGKPFSEVVVTIKSKKTVNAKFVLTYFVNAAGWTPSYDVRLKSLDEPLNFTFKSDVYQNTQEDWDNVALTLSTGNPTQNGVKPELYPIYVRYVTNYYRNGNYSKSAPQLYNEDVDMEEAYSIDGVAVQGNAALPSVAVVDRSLATDYVIDEKYSIKGTNKKQMVLVQEVDVAADYEHVAIPKLNKDAFLTAFIPNWEDYTFIDGPMSLYLEGKYTGQSYLYSQITSDTLELSLGKDKSVQIKREKIKDYREKKMIGSKKKEHYGYRIEVRNNKSSTIHLTIKDQIPISQNEEIDVDLEEKSDAEYNEETGYLVWEFDLTPSNRKELEFKYTIKYPSKKRIVIQ